MSGRKQCPCMGYDDLCSCQNGNGEMAQEQPADDWTQTDELAARLMAASIAAGYASGAESLAEVSYEMAEAFEAERQRRKGAGE